jgi:hypothetical protein
MDESSLVKTVVEIPTDVLDPLVKFVFDGTGYNDDEVYSQLVIPNLFPLYYQFRNVTDSGNIIMAVGMSKKEEIQMLDSEKSLDPFKGYLKKSPGTRLVELGISNGIFSAMRGVSYRFSEIMEFQKEGIVDGAILGIIFNNSLAYFYWCLSNISKGKRIGYIRNRNGSPDLNDRFHEMDMQRFIPGYNELRGHFNF